MGELKGWIINICTAVFFITAVEMLLPDNNMKKYAKFVMGLILITVLINPIVVLLNQGSNITTFLDKSIGLINEPDISVNNNADYKKISVDATLQVFQKNLEDTCIKKLKEKFPNSEYSVKAEVKYNDEKENYEVKSLEVDVSSSKSKIEKVKKVEINTSNNSTENTKLESEMSSEIKEFLSQELKISKQVISVFKAKT